ncbi:SGNH/GDSL hydrolase family protein [Paenibacillus sp. OV219]|uniref:SGNH/GDSL hydrolase family protein n=1 Tax=Paenibacillus sp. OV219 TaxID=1884377 RepID=UPI0008C1ED8A|nr:SGNH/GDSL hydrolase family protein [Paenibacillus sp. OV219]SEO17054.1 Lysophospholipase L1 [Paenibacillus sp. OV219]
MRLTSKDKLVMIGDSITDCERARPVGEGLFGAIGKGYVSVVDALLSSTYPELGIRVVNMGSSGNTVLDLKERWQTDVIDLKPDWLSIMIGTNDVWRQYDSPTIPEQHVYLEEYEATLDQLVAETLPSVKGIVLMTPFYIEPNTQDLMRAEMDRYGAAVKRIAEKHGTLFVDTQAAFNQVLEHLYSGTIAWDRVHPNHTGHAVLARTFLQVIGYDYNKGI